MAMVLPEIKQIVTQGNSSTYEIGPVMPALSPLLANMLRRVLLSSLPGAAITSVHIEGVDHEFQDIPDVKEDVAEIVQNLKKIRLRSFSERAVTLSLDVRGECVVTAAAIQVPSTIEIVNPEAHIATLDNEQARLSMKMTVGVGCGFVPFDAQNTRELPIGVIAIDAIYSPVVRVAYTVEHTRAGHMTNFEKIMLSITTDGTTPPDEALRAAADILRRQFMVLATGKYERDVPPPQASDALIPPGIYAMPLGDLGLTVRTYNALKRNGIQTVGPLLEMEGRALSMLHNIGERTLQEVCDCILAHNLLPAGKEE